jgi:hypothetical protein
MAGRRRVSRLWSRWVGANTLGETIGLGFTALVAVAIVPTVGAGDRRAVVLGAVAMLGAGAVEGVVLGFAQWRVLHLASSTVTARSWIGATTIGALVAWSLGMLPSVMIELGGQAGSEPPVTEAQQLALAAALGLALGPVLAAPQWWVLRRSVHRAGRWITANAVAWAAGMPVIFAFAGNVPADASRSLIVAMVIAACATAGAVVGAVHGTWLVRLLADPRHDEAPCRDRGPSALAGRTPPGG